MSEIKSNEQFIAAVAELVENPDCRDFDELFALCKHIKEERDIYYMAIDNSNDSFHIADKNGTVLFINKTFEKRSNVKRDFVIGMRLDQMEEYYKPSVARMALREKRKLTVIQSGSGGDACTTATPVLDDKGEPVLCVSNARFLDDIKMLEQYQNRSEALKHEHFSENEIVANDDVMKTLYADALNVANTDSSVLITGETGTGKSMLARYMHRHSSRAKNKFIEVNCASIPENLIESELFGYESGAFTGAKKEGKPGMFELADKGTLFMDEIGDMPINLQAKLLHVLQNKKIMRVGGIKEYPVDVRIITATNQNLEKKIENGLFRNDLYYRINVVPLKMPPLRERNADLDVLIQYFKDKFSKKYNKDIHMLENASNALHRYMWPGNIRELENIMEMLIVTNKTGVIDEDSLPHNVHLLKNDNREAIIVNSMLPLKEALEIVENKLVNMAFEDGASTYKAAQALGISQSGASRKYLKYVK